LNPEIAEFVGAFICDGFTGKYLGKKKFIYITQFTGDATLDLDYYKSVLFPIARQNFGFEKEFMKSYENGLRLGFYSKRLYEFWTERPV